MFKCLNRSLKLFLVCTVFAALGSAGLGNHAEARDFKRTSTVSGANGKSATVDTSVRAQRGEGVQRERTVTGPEGQSATKSTKGYYDPETQTYNREVTGYNGQQRGSVTTLDKENKTISTQTSGGGNRTTTYDNGEKSTTYTGKNGRTYNKTTTYSRGSVND